LTRTTSGQLSSAITIRNEPGLTIQVSFLSESELRKGAGQWHAGEINCPRAQSGWLEIAAAGGLAAEIYPLPADNVSYRGFSRHASDNGFQPVRPHGVEAGR
jgi:hypothetical protein